MKKLMLVTMFVALFGCAKTMPPAANPQTEAAKPAPPAAQEQLAEPTTEQKLVAANMVFNLIKAQCTADLEKADKDNDQRAFKIALEDCAAKFEAFVKVLEKIQQENKDPRYKQMLKNLVEFTKKLAKLHRDVAACYSPGATGQQIDECRKEVLKNFAAEMRALQGDEK